MRGIVGVGRGRGEDSFTKSGKEGTGLEEKKGKAVHSDIIPIIISFSITSLNSQMLDAGGCLDGMCSTPGDVVQKPLQLRWIRRAEAEQVMETSPRMYQELVLAQAVGQGRVRTAEMMAWTGRTP